MFLGEVVDEDESPSAICFLLANMALISLIKPPPPAPIGAAAAFGVEGATGAADDFRVPLGVTEGVSSA